MKKTIALLASLAWMATAFVSCEKTKPEEGGNDNPEPLPPVEESAIKFSKSPEDGAKIVFDHTVGIDSLAFELAWESETDGKYVLELSTDESMQNVFVQTMGKDKSFIVSNRLLNEIMSGLGKAYSECDLYYRVKIKDDSIDPSEVKNIKAKTEFDSFTDPRDGEVYPITKIDGREWMAENLRATVYSDGTSFYTDEYIISRVYNDGYLGKRAGVYYAYANAVNNRTPGCDFGEPVPADAQYQGICPEGWHIAANADFEHLFKKACESCGVSYVDPFDLSGQMNIASALRFSGDIRTLEDGCGYENTLGLYFVPSGFYEEKTLNTVIEPTTLYGGSTYLWSVTMMDDWWHCPDIEIATWGNDVHCWKRGNNPNNWAASIPLRCVKNY